MSESYDYIVVGGGTSGPVVAGRCTYSVRIHLRGSRLMRTVSEDPNVTILILEAGKDSKEMESMHVRIPDNRSASRNHDCQDQN
jgi:hypothetical protein